MRTCVRRHARALACAVALVPWLAGDAGAVTLAASSVPFDFGGTGERAGVVDFLGTHLGIPPGGSVLEGTIAPDAEVLIFRLTLAGTSNAVGSVRVGATVGETAVTRTPTGGGTVAGSGVPIAEVARIGDFEAFGFGAGLGARSDPFFVALADLQPGDRLQFGFPGTGRVDFVGVGVVPEPSTAALLGIALAGLAAIPRRRLSG